MIAPAFHEHVLRVVSESLGNIARHAQAHQVWVRTFQQESMLTIEIRDDGIGFDLSHEATRAGHYGLLGLRERARLAGGRLEIESASGRGTTMRFTLPTAKVTVSRQEDSITQH
jgi:NarL family two-component system sensor histidine kinase YdfH